MTIKVLQICAVDFTVRHFLLPLIRRLEKEGYDVTAACSRGECFAALVEDGVRLTEIPVSRNLNALSHAMSTWRLYRFLKKNPHDIIHVHTPIAGLIGRMSATLAKVPVRIYTAHGFYFHDDMSKMKRKFHVNLERFGGKMTDYLFTQSDEDRQTAIREKIIQEDHVRTIGNGIDLERFNPEAVLSEIREARLKEFDIPPDAPVIGIIGRLVREKGYFELVEAAEKLNEKFPDCRFLCIGSALKSDHDDSQSAILRSIRNAGLQNRFIFAGLRKDIPELLSIMSIYTLPSWREGMPRSIIEAMAMELPVVATDIRGCREEVIHGESGFIVPPRDGNSLYMALEELLSHPEKAVEFGKAGRKRAEKEFSEELVLDRQLEIYENLIREKGLEAKQ